MARKYRVAAFVTRITIFLLWLAIVGFILIIPRIRFVEHNALSVFAWPGVFSEEQIKRFEQETGIKVYLSSYASNEELLVKLRATRGHGYDLVMPSDYAVKKLIDEGLLKKIDKQKLNFVEALNPVLMGHSFDLNNDYALPYVWELYLMGMSRAFRERHAVTEDTAWNLIFKPQLFGSDYRLIMINDPVDVIAFASHYLFGPVTTLTPDQLQQLQQLLIAQRPWVEAYSNVRSDYYLGTRNATVALAHSAEIWRAIRDYSAIDFVVPRDTFISIEYCALPAASTKEDLVYQFLNYFYKKEVCAYHFNVFRSCPARLDVIDQLEATDHQKSIMKSSPAQFKHYMFMRDIISEQQKYDLWTSVKA